MLLKKIARSIRDMPRAAYIFLRAVLALCCLMLLVSFTMFVISEKRPWDRDIYMTAVLLLESGAGLLLLGGIGTAAFIDLSR